VPGDPEPDPERHGVQPPRWSVVCHGPPFLYTTS
jgi:hypothetical protein